MTDKSVQEFARMVAAGVVVSLIVRWLTTPQGEKVIRR